MRKAFIFVVLVAVALSIGGVSAQAPAPPAKLDANMLQLMRGILYPASNVLFAAQEDPGKQPKPEDASTSPNPLTSTYGGWTAVENAGLALAEASRLLTIPGRMCSSGHPTRPSRAPTGSSSAAGLRKASASDRPTPPPGRRASDAMSDVSGKVSDACQACHEVWSREKGRRKRSPPFRKRASSTEWTA